MPTTSETTRATSPMHRIRTAWLHIVGLAAPYIVFPFYLYIVLAYGLENLWLWLAATVVLAVLFTVSFNVALLGWRLSQSDRERFD